MAYTYTGYLEPWLGEILTKGRAGRSCQRIASDLGKRIHDHYKDRASWLPANKDSLSASIRHILNRYDISTTTLANLRARAAARSDLVWNLRQEGKTYNAIAKEIEVSRERVRQILKIRKTKLDYATRMKIKKARFDEVIEELWPIKPTTSLGRPIDMGGPRDTWIEASPWDNI